MSKIANSLFLADWGRVPNRNEVLGDVLDSDSDRGEGSCGCSEKALL